MNRDTVSQLTLAEFENESRTLHITSDLNYQNASGLVDAVTTSLKNHPQEIVLDMNRVEMIDSSGLRALLQSRKRCVDSNVKFKLFSLSNAVERVIAMSGFATLFGLSPLEHIPSEDKNHVCSKSETWKVMEYQAASDPTMISVLRGKIMDAATSAGAIGDTLCDIQIAVGEALTNSYRHGSPVKGTSKIKLRCMTCCKAVVIEIEDEGDSFDPDAICKPDPNAMRDHGMGIFLMRQAMDVVEFYTGCPGNRVRMIKWLNAD